MMNDLNESLQFGWTFHQRRDYLGAEAMYRRVLDQDPRHADAWCYLGILCYDRSRYAESVDCYERAVAARPEFPVALSNMANSLGALQRYEEAEASVRRALELNPRYTTAWNNLGALLVKQGKFAEAETTFQRALELTPDSESAHRNLGAVLIRQGKFQEGSRHSEAALRLDPRNAEAHRNRAIVRLLTGDFSQGWDEYEWRFHCRDHAPSRHPQPVWQGQRLAGRTLLLYAEQGLGDTIHFLRYAELARQRGGRVIVECQPPLVPVLSTYRHLDQLVPRGEPLPALDLQLALMSAPRVFQTRLDSIPAEIPYLFAQPARVAYWKERLDQLCRPRTLRVGLVWQGSTDHHADRQRSIQLEQFLPLGQDKVQFISLQKGEGTEQLRPCADRLPVLSFPDELDEEQGPFVDTAAILSNVDVLMSIDTSVAHLAGALGVPTWLLLPISPDWRWLLDRSDSPWYPSFRLFRQTREGDWDDVIERVREALSDRIAR
jgi:tetratricopeptide (TPR) repeat protein